MSLPPSNPRASTHRQPLQLPAQGTTGLDAVGRASSTFRAFWRPYALSQAHVGRLLGGRVIHAEWPGRKADVLLGWGRKRAGTRALEAALSSGRPCLLVEDGFIRSIGLGPDEPGFAIVVDDLGIYYDATTPSRLEALVLTASARGPSTRAEHLVQSWRQCRVSKYNAAREVTPPVECDYVLAVDQTAGDSSITYGQADSASFHRMLEAALDEHPRRPILLKVHPDVIAGRKAGHFAHLTGGEADRIMLITGNAHPPSLLSGAAAVYVVTSQMGFEALLWDKPVRCFGMPFYAGWGLTQDQLGAPGRRRRVALSHLVQAALVDYARYLDPETLEPCAPERLIEWMGLQRRLRERFPQRVQARGFREWKQPVARVFFSGSTIEFGAHDEALTSDDTVALWGMAPLPSNGAPQRTVRVEDGFLRSVGLGADLIRPMSWVMDTRGMYFDASGPSDLEHLLANADFGPNLLRRARVVRERVTTAGLTKYNVGRDAWQRPVGPRQVVLVPGQVETDASIQHGALGEVRTNLDLLRAARAMAPDAYIVYKPHPDVGAGLRAQGADESLAPTLCDEHVTDVPMHLLLDGVDEVHTMTSLAGFEALLRGRTVVCHGCPFYAGWGLTEDRVPMPRRGRKLTVDELVAAALILYPTYVSRSSGHFTTPERAIEELLAWRGADGRLRRWPLWLRPFLSRWRVWRGR